MSDRAGHQGLDLGAQHACPECGFDAAGAVAGPRPAVIRDNATPWEVVLGSDDAADRPSPHVWSPLEYACHVRDVHRALRRTRLRLMLDEDEPAFANWDQDATAVEERLRPRRTRRPWRGELVEAADAVAESTPRCRATSGSAARHPQQRRPSSPSTPSPATTCTTWSTTRTTSAPTSPSGSRSRPTTRTPRSTARAPSDARRRSGPRWSASSRALGPGARVLEIGTGAGRDARALEEAGAVACGVPTSRRPSSPCCAPTGHEADVLDPLVDDLADLAGDAPYDGVWANASLLHVRRERPARGAGQPGRRDPARRGAQPVASRRATARAWSTHGRRRRPAALHVLARAEAARRARRGRLGGRRGRDRATSPRGEEWLDVRGEAPMRHTEFWARMEAALGPAYARAWADQSVMADLGGRTAQEALDAGVPPKEVWPRSGPRWSCLRSTDDDRSGSTRSRPSAGPSARSSSRRRSARSGSPSGSRPPRCWPATSPARRRRPGSRRPSRCSARRSRRTCWPG